MAGQHPYAGRRRALAPHVVEQLLVAHPAARAQHQRGEDRLPAYGPQIQPPSAAVRRQRPEQAEPQPPVVTVRHSPPPVPASFSRLHITSSVLQRNCSAAREAAASPNPGGLTTVPGHVAASVPAGPRPGSLSPWQRIALPAGCDTTKPSGPSRSRSRYSVARTTRSRSAHEASWSRTAELSPCRALVAHPAPRTAPDRPSYAGKAAALHRGARADPRCIAHGDERRTAELTAAHINDSLRNILGGMADNVGRTDPTVAQMH